MPVRTRRITLELHSNGEIMSGAKRNIHGAEMATEARPTNKIQYKVPPTMLLGSR